MTHNHLQQVTLAIDPGYERLGTAIVAKDAQGKELVLYSNCFKTSAREDFVVRLQALGDEIERLIAEFSPDALAIENLFFNTNQKTAMKVAEARGAILYVATSHDLEVFEYTPLQIKVAITGYGRANKSEITRMVEVLVDLTDKKMIDDEYDAIATGLTHLASHHNN